MRSERGRKSLWCPYRETHLGCPLTHLSDRHLTRIRCPKCSRGGSGMLQRSTASSCGREGMSGMDSSGRFQNSWPEMSHTNPGSHQSWLQSPTPQARWNFLHGVSQPGMPPLLLTQPHSHYQSHSMLVHSVQRYTGSAHRFCLDRYSV